MTYAIVRRQCAFTCANREAGAGHLFFTLISRFTLTPSLARVQGENVPRAPTSSKTEIFLLIFFALLAILGIISSFY